MKYFRILFVVVCCVFVEGGLDNALYPPASRLLAPYFKEKFNLRRSYGIEGPHISSVVSFGHLLPTGLRSGIGSGGMRHTASWMLEQYAVNETKNFCSVPSVTVFSLLRGGPIDIHIIDPESGDLTTKTLGPKNRDGFVAQIPAGHYSAFKVRKTKRYPFRFALFSLVSLPEMMEGDESCPRRAELLSKFPLRKRLITRFTNE
ncbi:unnamed protein product [Clavelina lepadiformis]|uniref:DUF985 domain-containing protein n=1 Tax=Clavelina lepadiformis TaxID=159417 RepID=A0ABP0GZP8_CLALP